MAFLLSPLVATIENDWSATVQAVATSVGALVLENTERGQEMTKILVSNTDDLIKKFGKPTNNEKNYISMLTAVQALARMNKLYCTTVKPEDATFAGIYSTLVEDDVTKEKTTVFLPLSSDLTDTTKKAYNLKSFTSNDSHTFAEEIQPDGFADFIALSRGKWGNRIRLALINKSTYDILIRKNNIAEAAKYNMLLY